MKPTLDYDTAKRLLRELAAERPDYVYRTQDSDTDCQYTNPDGTPSCIVGHVLQRIGVTIPPGSLGNTRRANQVLNDYVNVTRGQGGGVRHSVE